MLAPSKLTDALIGKSPDEITLLQRRSLRGLWMAVEIYSPENLALRRIAAIAETASDCRRYLRDQGQDLTCYEYRMIR